MGVGFIYRRAGRIEKIVAKLLGVSELIHNQLAVHTKHYPINMGREIWPLMSINVSFLNQPTY